MRGFDFFPAGSFQGTPEFEGWLNKIAFRFNQLSDVQSFTANGSPEQNVFWLRVDASGGSRTITLPTAVGRAGQKYGVIKTDSSTNTVVVDPAGSETINGSSAATLYSQYAAMVCVSNGTNWEFISAPFQRFKSGSFTRDLATASGTQTVTGVGFFPSLLVAFVSVNGGGVEASAGISDGTTEGCMSWGGHVTANTWFQTGTWIFVFEDGSKFYQGVVTSRNSDGFVVTWTRTSTPTGTITINFGAWA